MRGFPQSAILLQGNSIPHIEYTKSVFILGQHDTLGVAVHKSLLVGLVLKTTGHFTEVSRRPGSEQSLRAVGGTQKCRHVVHVVSFSALNTFPVYSGPPISNCHCSLFLPTEPYRQGTVTVKDKLAKLSKQNAPHWVWIPSIMQYLQMRRVRVLKFIGRF
jgi:ribosomal protein L39E